MIARTIGLEVAIAEDRFALTEDIDFRIRAGERREIAAVPWGVDGALLTVIDDEHFDPLTVGAVHIELEERFAPEGEPNDYNDGPWRAREAVLHGMEVS